MHRKELVTAGKPLDEAKKVLIMLHGRGATADDILGLTPHLLLDDFCILAPQATNYSWYPYSFLMPVKQNEPWLSSALALLSEVVSDVNRAGIDSRKIFFLGFSQGACLTLEFIARNATKWGGAVAFTGGLIGDQVLEEHYHGDLKNTPMFIGTSDPDLHVPVERVNASVEILKKMNASVTRKIYPGMGHTVIKDEIDLANKFVFKNQ
jgi:phospholipase/carboxylesterase